MMAPLPEYHVRQSQKAKNLRLKVSRHDGLCVVVPLGFDETKIPPVLRRKKEWIADAMRRVGETRRFLESPAEMHLPDKLRLVALGETWAVTYYEQTRRGGIKLRADGGELVISGVQLSRDAVIRKLKQWLRARVREALFPLAAQMADRHRLPLNGLLVKSQRTRWASCSAQKNLSLNTKLLFLSPELVRYVLIHELCHTAYMDHSHDFWRLVAAHEPKYKSLDQGLRDAWKKVPQWAF